MDGYADTDQDNGGVYINSGIPSYAFCLAVTKLGRYLARKLG
jgi:Zn-dependent metalloprotease